MNIEDKLGCHRAVYVQGFPLKYALWFQTQVNRFGLKLHGQDFMGSSKKQEGDQRPSVRTELDEAWPKVSSVFYWRTQWVRLPHRPLHLYSNAKAALWRQGGGQLHKPMPVCRSTGMHLVSSGFSGWLFVLAGGHAQFLPNWNTFSGRAGPTILILVEAKVSLFIKLPFVIFIEQNDNLSNRLHSVFQQERVFLPPTRVCDLLISSIVQ